MLMSAHRRRLPALALLALASCVEGPLDDGPDDGFDPSTPEPGDVADEGGGDRPGVAAVQVCGASIQAAINAASSGAVIEICAGTYNERLVIDNKRLELRGAGAATTIIDGGASGRVVDVRNTTGTGVFLTGLTLRRGRTAGAGGGVSCSASTLKLRSMVLSGNVGLAGGGGLYASGCALDVSTTRVEGNDAGDGDGGGALLVSSSGVVGASAFIANRAGEGGGVATRGGTADLNDSEIRGNVATRGGGLHLGSDGDARRNDVIDNDATWTGGGIYVDDHAPTIEGNTIAENTSVNDGGGVYVHEGPGAILVDNVVTANHSGDDGGGIRIFTSRARLERNVIEDNVADDSGGGVRVSHLPCEIIDNVIRGNQAEMGGGMDLDNDSSVVRGGVISGNRAVLGGGVASALYPWNGGTIEDVQFLDNQATSKGGAIYMVDNYQSIRLRGLTMRGNTAGRGAGMFVRSTNFTLANSAFDRNSATGAGGALHVAAYAWTSACPCPPTSTTGALDFVVAHGNVASTGSALWTEVGGLSLENSIFTGNSGTGVTVSGAAAPTWRYNDTLPRAFSGMADPTGSAGNLAVDPQFVGAGTGDFRLAAGSPAIDAADPALKDLDGTRADMGLFGGPAGGPADCAGCPPPSVRVATLVADAQVAAASPTTNFGGAATIGADSSPLIESYLKFQVSGVTGSVTSARLRLKVTDASSDGPAVYAAGSGWSESTVTWNGRPARSGSALDDLGSAAIGAVVEYDVSDLVTGDGVYTLALVPTSSSGFAASSREGGSVPELIYTVDEDAPGPVCGDATCDGGESCSSCPGDCGACPGPGPAAVLLADAQVAAASPTANFGGAATIGADSSPLIESYLKFQVTGVTGPVTARLRLKVTDASSDGPAIYAAGSGWSESTVTWNSRPARSGSALDDLGSAAIGAVVEYDVSDLVTGDGVYTLALVPTSSSGFGASSGEGASAPVLVLEAGAAAGPIATLEADAQVAAASPTANFGGAATIGADSSPLIESYLKFQVTGVTGPVTSARLRLRVTDATSDGPAVYAAGSGWSESTLTWNSRPARSGSALADLGSAAIGAVVEYDVSDLVTGDGVYTLALVPTSSSGFGASSGEGASPPELIVE